MLTATFEPETTDIMTTGRVAWLALGASLALAGAHAACDNGTSACQAGANRCLCYGNGTCNPGLICAQGSGICVSLGDAGTVGTESTSSLPSSSTPLKRRAVDQRQYVAGEQLVDQRCHAKQQRGIE